MNDNLAVSDQLLTVMRRVLKDPRLVWSRELSSWDVPAWDSITNAQLLVEVEESFELRFSTPEVLALKCAGDLLDLIMSKSRGAN